MAVPDPKLVDELADLAGKIAAAGAAAGPLWGQAHKLMLKIKVPPGDAAKLIMNRDADGLVHLAKRLRGEEAAPAPAPPPATDAPRVDPEAMKKAMRAFRKRLKLIRLDHESKLGVGPMTGGKKADFDAILPPQEYPREVWEALADAGQLKRAGGGFYMLCGEGEGLRD